MLGKAFVCSAVVSLLVLLTTGGVSAFSFPGDFVSTTFAVRALDAVVDTGNQSPVAAFARNFLVVFGFAADAASATYGELGAAAAIDCLLCSAKQSAVANALLSDTIQASGIFFLGESLPITITEVLSDTITVTSGGFALAAFLTDLLLDHGHAPVGEVVIRDSSSDPATSKTVKVVVNVIAPASGVFDFRLLSVLETFVEAIDDGSALVNALNTGKIFLDALPGITLTAASGHDYSTPSGLVAPTPVREPAPLLLLGSGLAAMAGVTWRSRRLQQQSSALKHGASLI